MSDALLLRRSKVLRFFPVPRYLAIGSLACAIDEDTFRFIELAPQGDHMIVRRYGEKKLPLPLASDADDIPADIKKAAAKIALDEKMRSVAIVLPERLAYAFFITIPIVEDAFIREALAFKLEEHIPIPPAEVIFEFDVIKRDERAHTMTIAVRAVARRQVEKYIELFSSLGILVTGCETEGRAALLSALSPSDSVCRLVIKINAAGTVLCIAQGASILFSSSIAFGAGEITGTDEHSLPALSGIRDEARKILDYWNSRSDVDNTKTAESVLLFGSAATRSGVKEYLEAALSCPTSLAHVWQNACAIDEVVPEIDAVRALDFASVIGASLSQ